MFLFSAGTGQAGAGEAAGAKKPMSNWMIFQKAKNMEAKVQSMIFYQI